MIMGKWFDFDVDLCTPYFGTYFSVTVPSWGWSFIKYKEYKRRTVLVAFMCITASAYVDWEGNSG